MHEETSSHRPLRRHIVPEPVLGIHPGLLTSLVTQGSFAILKFLMGVNFTNFSKVLTINTSDIRKMNTITL